MLPTSMNFVKSSKMEFLEIGSPDIPANVEIKKKNILIPVLIILGIGAITYYKQKTNNKI